MSQENAGSGSWPRCEFNVSHLQKKFEATFAADIHAINPLVDRIMKMAGELGCAQGKEVAVELALREALANAILHGCKNDPSKQVQCCIACEETQGMLIVVRDPGPGFDFSQLPSPLRGRNLYSEHGRGIYLINQLMDEVSYERGGTEIHMRKH